MSKLLEDTVSEIKKLPAPEQDAAAGLLIDYLANKRPSLMSDEQLAEVRRRVADPNQELVSFDDAKEFIRRLIS
jgi:hypothetical protein